MKRFAFSILAFCLGTLNVFSAVQATKYYCDNNSAKAVQRAIDTISYMLPDAVSKYLEENLEQYLASFATKTYVNQADAETLNAAKEYVDSKPTGYVGIGTPTASANTLDPDSYAMASVSIDSSSTPSNAILNFVFGIPRGQTGPMGPANTRVSVDTNVTVLSSVENPKVEDISNEANELELHFSLPTSKDVFTNWCYYVIYNGNTIGLLNINTFSPEYIGDGTNGYFNYQYSYIEKSTDYRAVFSEISKSNQLFTIKGKIQYTPITPPDIAAFTIIPESLSGNPYDGFVGRWAAQEGSNIALVYNYKVSVDFNMADAKITALNNAIFVNSSFVITNNTYKYIIDGRSGNVLTIYGDRYSELKEWTGASDTLYREYQVDENSTYPVFDAVWKMYPKPGYNFQPWLLFHQGSYTYIYDPQDGSVPEAVDAFPTNNIVLEDGNEWISVRYESGGEGREYTGGLAGELRSEIKTLNDRINQIQPSGTNSNSVSYGTYVFNVSYKNSSTSTTEYEYIVSTYNPVIYSQTTSYTEYEYTFITKLISGTAPSSTYDYPKYIRKRIYTATSNNPEIRITYQTGVSSTSTKTFTAADNEPTSLFFQGGKVNDRVYMYYSNRY